MESAASVEREAIIEGERRLYAALGLRAQALQQRLLWFGSMKIAMRLRRVLGVLCEQLTLIPALRLDVLNTPAAC